MTSRNSFYVAVRICLGFIVTLFTTNAQKLPSWNAAVSCSAASATVRQILGTQQNSMGGALQADGWAYTIPDKNSLAPPCSSGGGATFVEIHKLLVVAHTQTIYSDGDYAFNLTDQSGSPNLNAYMKTIHVEDSAPFQQHGLDPPLTITPGLPTTLVAGQLIDIQGFVYWDSAHVSEAWHSFSGWEIHPLTAWRISSSSPPVSNLPPVSVILSYQHNATITTIAGNVVSVNAENGSSYTATVTPSSTLYDGEGTPDIAITDMQVSDPVIVNGKYGVTSIELGYIEDFALSHDLNGTVSAVSASQVAINSGGTIYLAPITQSAAFYDRYGVSIPESSIAVGDSVYAYGLIRGTLINLKYIKDFSKP